LYIVSITKQNLTMQAGPSENKVSEQNRAYFTYQWKATVSHEKVQNFANWPAEFGKIFSGKLWAIVISNGFLGRFAKNKKIHE